MRNANQEIRNTVKGAGMGYGWILNADMTEIAWVMSIAMTDYAEISNVVVKSIRNAQLAITVIRKGRRHV